MRRGKRRACECVADAADHPRGVRGERLLQGFAVLFQMQQHRARGGERERMAHERPGEKRHRRFGKRIVTEAPRPAVERVQKFRASRDRADGEAAADDFAVGRDVRAHAEMRLRAAGMAAEAGDDLVENQRDAMPRRERAKLVQKLARLKSGPPALHRLDEHRRDFVRVRCDFFQRTGVAVVEDDRVRERFGRNARRDRRGAVARDFSPEHLVGDAVVALRKINHLRATRHRARDAQRAGHRLGTGVAKRRALGAGQLTEQRGDFARERRCGADLHAARKLLADRPDDKLRLMPEHRGTETERHVDPFVAVDVPELCARRAIDDDRIDHLLPRLLEARDRARIGKMRAVFLRVCF